MSEQENSKIEREQRLAEFFKQDSLIWQDLKTEITIDINNEKNKLNTRNNPDRDWSAGYVSGQMYVLDLERYYKKQWTQ